MIVVVSSVALLYLPCLRLFDLSQLFPAKSSFLDPPKRPAISTTVALRYSSQETSCRVLQGPHRAASTFPESRQF